MDIRSDQKNMQDSRSLFDAQDIDTLCINTIRFLSVDAVQKANSGHPGMPMGAAPMGYVLWTRFMKTSPSNPKWFDRDRFLLSAGHGSMLLYSLLHLCGFGISLDDIKRFRQWGSIAPGHPEFGITPGVDTTTGPLGQGFANGVGMAVTEAHLAARFNKPGFPMIDHCTYGIVSDGDLMEGVASEAASLAGHLKLGKLIYLYDANQVSLSGATSLTISEDFLQRFESYGWHTQYVEDGNDVGRISQALHNARLEGDKPSLIAVRTHIGYGSVHLQDTFEVHGAPLGAAEVNLTKKNLKWPVEPAFLVPQQVLEHCTASMERGRRAFGEWNARCEEYAKKYPDLSRELHAYIEGTLPDGWKEVIPSFPADGKGIATRVASGKILNALSSKIPNIIGGSADLDPSTHTVLKEKGDFEAPVAQQAAMQGAVGGPWGYEGRNIHFGVREHAMGAILNGMAAHGGVIPYGATFLVFSDYMRPPMRLAAIMELNVIYVFTHDSIGLGEDGKTHQPVEHLANLRTVPDCVVIRPADANETAAAWAAAISIRNKPVALILARQNVPTLDRTVYAPADGLHKGAYILKDTQGKKPDILLVATGSEVHLVVEAEKKLRERAIHARVISMPSWELFEEQPPEYRRSIFDPSVKKRLAVEAGTSMGWCKYLGDGGEMICINRFGASAPGSVLMREYGFTVDAVVQKALELLS